MPAQTFVPHLRLSMLGTIPDGEQFSCNLSLRPDYSAWTEAVDLAAKMAVLTALLTSADEDWFTDLVTDCTNYWQDLATEISSRAILTRVKVAAIGSDGHYTGAPKEAAVNVPGGRTPDFNEMFPFQVARKVTLETDADLGRIKGGFYLPGVTSRGFDATTNLSSAAIAGSVQGRTATFLDDLNNAPGLDTHALKVIVASQGRHNRDGSVRLGPGNYDVVRVNVGRRVDIQRRRANKISEARIADSNLE
jgi:hypothetical protein